MILLDLIFKICYGPFQKSKNGRLAAIIWVIPIVSFSLLGLTKVFLYFIGLDTPPAVTGLLGIVLSAGVFFLFNKIYLKEMRPVSNVRYPILMGVLIPILIVLSIIVMSISLGRY